MKLSNAPNRALAEKERAGLVRLDAKGSRTDAPEALPGKSLVMSPALFQPRFDSIAFGPGRSEAHIAELAKVVRRGSDLDPITIIAFGQNWYLIDGHHRLEAYGAAGRDGPVPVRVLKSDLQGAARVKWAVEASFADNNKNRLNLSATDGADGAWRSVWAGEEGSKSQAAKTYKVSESLIAKMRVTRKGLAGHRVPTDRLCSWRGAQGALAELACGEGTKRAGDYVEALRRKLAKGLKGVMALYPAPDLLADALEAYEPGIIAAMMQSRADDDDDDIDEIGIPDGKAPPGDAREAFEGEEAWDAEAREQLDALAREEPDTPIGA